MSDELDHCLKKRVVFFCEGEVILEVFLKAQFKNSKTVFECFFGVLRFGLKMVVGEEKEERERKEGKICRA